MIKKSELWERIQAARKRASKSQGDIAAHFGIDRSAISQWESRREDRRTRPDVEKLEEFGRITQTPLWWLLSDESDVHVPWPYAADERGDAAAAKPAALARYLQDFWKAATLRTMEKREDLWGKDVWEPEGPVWMKAITPDAMSEKALVCFVTAPRPDLAKISNLAAGMLAFERTQQKEYPRKYVMVWRPNTVTWPKVYKNYVEDLDRIQQLALVLAKRVGFEYLEVSGADEAAEYLTQIL